MLLLCVRIFSVVNFGLFIFDSYILILAAEMRMRRFCSECHRSNFKHLEGTRIYVFLFAKCSS